MPTLGYRHLSTMARVARACPILIDQRMAQRSLKRQALSEAGIGAVRRAVAAGETRNGCDWARDCSENTVAGQILYFASKSRTSNPHCVTWQTWRFTLPQEKDRIGRIGISSYFIFQSFWSQCHRVKLWSSGTILGSHFSEAALRLQHAT